MVKRLPAQGQFIARGYQHCSEAHLHRYLAEFDFRYNHRVAKGVDDRARMTGALKGAKGKRLLYRDSLGG
jgi:hypothetical protein